MWAQQEPERPNLSAAGSEGPASCTSDTTDAGSESDEPI